MQNNIFFYIWRKKRIIIPVLLIIVFAVTCIIIINREKNKVYKKYEIISEKKFESISSARYESFKDGIIRYDGDGLSFYRDGKEVFNKAFQMSSPILDVRGTYIVVADRNTTNICLINGSGKGYDITATCAVVGVTVSKKWVVAAIIDDGTANYIELYDKNGDRLVSGRTVVEGDGYPVSISISDDSNKLVASYLSISEGQAHSKVVFYNYSSVGKNEVDRIVGGFNQYDDTLVPKVKFIDNNTVAAFGDNRFSIYDIDEKPKLVYETKLKEEIESVFHNEKNIGIVFKSNSQKYNHLLKVYDLKGNEECAIKINFDFSGIKFADENVVMNDKTRCMMYSFSGKQRFNKEIGTDIADVEPVEDNVYYVVHENKYEKIKLK